MVGTRRREVGGCQREIASYLAMTDVDLNLTGLAENLTGLGDLLGLNNKL
jgi:hypothetical protein